MIRGLLLVGLTVLLVGCQGTASQFIRSAEEVQADNDNYWAEVEKRKAAKQTTIVNTKPVVIKKTIAEQLSNDPAILYPVPNKEELERLPLGP